MRTTDDAATAGDGTTATATATTDDAATIRTADPSTGRRSRRRRRTPRGTRVTVGERFAPRSLRAIGGATIAVPDGATLTHLQFRRFAGCPVCHVHLQSIVRRHAEIRAAGVTEVVLFHSTEADLLRHEAGLPFAVVADPDQRLYRALGVEPSPRALLDPRAWPAIVVGVVRGSWAMLRERAPMPPLRPLGGRFGLPADLLVAADGRVVAAHYGEHADDQWSVDDLLALARLAGSGA
jgi:hypothetical protein